MIPKFLDFAVVTLLFLPWVNPIAPGPSPSVVPWLLTFVCAAGILWLYAVYGNTWAVSENLQPSNLQRFFGVSLLTAGLVSCVLSLVQFFNVEVLFGPWILRAEPGNTFANLRQRNQFASLTNLALAALLWLVVQVRQPHLAATYQRFSPHRSLLFAAAALLAVGNSISSSRTGLFQLLLLCGLYAVWGRLRFAAVRRLLICAVLTYGVAMFAMPWLAGFDVTSNGAFARLGKDDACSSRLVLWSNVLTLIAQKPWLGWGWGELDYAHFITLYNEPRFCDILDNAHNLPLHLAVELGLPVALLVCGSFTWWVLHQKPWAEHDPTRQMAWAVITVILLHSMLEYPLWYGPFQMAFGLCILLLRRRKQPMKAQTSPETASNWLLVRILWAQAAVVLMAFIVYAAWDYHRISQIYLEPESRSAAYRANTLDKIRSSWLFADQVQFAELLITPLTTANAEWTRNTAKQLLHYSPEPRVVEKLIESAVLLNEDDDALAYLARYKAAFPKEHSLWTKRNSTPL